MTEQRTTEVTGIDPLDRIDKAIDIDASPERVWDLVSRPGWWINDGTVDAEPDVRQEGEVTVVRHARHGEFRLLTVAAERPERSTLVEFRIAPQGTGVRLSVAESGFSSLSPDRSVWLADRTGNVEGWDTELAAARTFVEGS
jgi:uncharacterized protein YndB with AHSA1/START domain